MLKSLPLLAVEVNFIGLSEFLLLRRTLLIVPRSGKQKKKAPSRTAGRLWIANSALRLL
ncbi:MAG: hypothetical protein AAFN10_02775 [Bacteroidota bacterium]